jgi:LuxR family maltose regulon positive regulatory protein
MEPTPLLTTKLTVPPTRSQIVSRFHLLKRLNDALSYQLTLLSAPAGFGKTTLLSEWANQCDQRLAWISLDNRDNDPDRFLSYLISAFQGIHPEASIGESALAARQNPQPFAFDSVLTILVNDVAQISKPIILVIDDYHLISSSAIHGMLEFLLDHLPRNFHLILATRKDPPLPLARLRGRSQLMEITEEDLRFTSREVKEFLGTVMGLELSVDNLNKLQTRTEGWITGLQLVALSLQNRKEPEPFIQSITGAHRYILDYLADEVLNDLPSGIQTFLMKTSILDRMTAKLCDEIIGKIEDWDGASLFLPQPTPRHPNSQFLLEFFDATNLFISPLDNERKWYKYHPLFAEFLQARLTTLMPDEVHELHRGACDWFAREGFIAEAINHALVGGIPERAADLMELEIKKMLIRGEISTLLYWIDALPEQMVDSRPRLLLALGWALLIRDLSRLQETLPRLIQQLSQNLGVEPENVLDALKKSVPDSQRRLDLCEFALILAFIQRDIAPPNLTIGLFEKTLEFLPLSETFIRGVALGGLGSMYVRSGKVLLAEQAFSEAAEMSRASKSMYGLTIALGWKAAMQVQQGRLILAADTYRQALHHFADRHGRLMPLSGLNAIGLADILREQNNLEEAFALVHEGMDVARKVNDYDALREGPITLARLYYATGELDCIPEPLRDAEQIAFETGSPDCLYEAKAWQAYFNLVLGNVQAAKDWGIERGLENEDVEPSLKKYSEIELLTFTRLLITQQKYHGALSLLEKLLNSAEEDGRNHSVIQILILQALTLHSLGHREESIRQIARALLLAQPEGYIRSFIDQDPAMAVILRNAAALGHSPNYVQVLLSIYGESVANDVILDPLSERELEVLQLIADGLSNPQIAKSLIIAVSTVKTHVNKIYSKLGVRTRTEAVARARELKLIS